MGLVIPLLSQSVTGDDNTSPVPAAGEPGEGERHRPGGHWHRGMLTFARSGFIEYDRVLFFSDALRIARVPLVFLASIPVALVAPQNAPYMWLLIFIFGLLINRFWPQPDEPEPIGEDIRSG